MSYLVLVLSTTVYQMHVTPYLDKTLNRLESFNGFCLYLNCHAIYSLLNSGIPDGFRLFMQYWLMISYYVCLTVNFTLVSKTTLVGAYYKLFGDSYNERQEEKNAEKLRNKREMVGDDPEEMQKVEDQIKAHEFRVFALGWIKERNWCVYNEIDFKEWDIEADF